MSSFEPIGPASEAIKSPAKSGWEPVNVREYEAHAAEYMPKNVFDYFASGANDMITLRENRAAYQRLRMRPRILRDVSKVDISTTILGDKISFPICVAPSAMQRMAHDDGENATARACAKAGTLSTLSSWSTVALEEVARAGAAAEPSAPRWFQLYVYKDRGLTLELVRRAEAAGYRALVVTVDMPVLGRREADVRNRFGLPPHLTIANFAAKGDAHASGVKAGGGHGSGLAVYVAGLIDSSLDWADLAWLKEHTAMKLVVKGVMTAEDARLACEAGVDGIWVSNHGARQLDTCLATIEVVPEVVAAVDGRCEVYVDGGVTRGADAFKALALGCRAVFVCRPTLWGLAHSGEAGVAHVLQLLRAEFEMAMQLNGCTRVGEIRRAMVCHASEFAKL
ncbi:unnamed protein product [Heterosigma akashiwo]